MVESATRRAARSQSDHDAAIQALKQDLVYAAHILDRDGQTSDIGGHLTARLPGSQSFWTYQWGQGFDEVTYDDIVEADFELKTITGRGRVNPTLHIHTRIYLARPDVNCIVHTHGENAVALGAIGQNLQPFWQFGALFFEDCVLFDEFDGIVLDKAEGDRIAEALKGNRGILLKNHGMLVVADSIRLAGIGALHLETACKVQLKAMSAGKLQLMPAEAARQTKRFLQSDDFLGPRWAHLVRGILRDQPDLKRD
jgi:L-fuculose-phosphate aldolase